MTFNTIFGLVEFEAKTLSIFRQYQQCKTDDPEAGGQLFVKEFGTILHVALATPPHHKDRRTRFSFVAKRREQQREINVLYTQGFHYVGDWHTHPEPVPNPSHMDYTSMRTIATQSKHELSTLLFVIVGNDPKRLVLDVQYTIGSEVRNAPIQDAAEHALQKTRLV